MYNHGIATLALSEAYILTGDSALLEPAIQSYHRQGATAYAREEAVVYLAGVLDCDLSAARRERIDRFFQSVQATEPDLYRRSIKRLEGRRKIMNTSE